MPTIECPNCGERIRDLEDENARLRHHLRAMIDIADKDEWYNDKVIEAAREALNDRKED